MPQTKDKPQEGSADSFQVYALASCPYIEAQIITNVIPRVPDYSSSIMCPKTLLKLPRPSYYAAKSIPT